METSHMKKITFVLPSYAISYSFQTNILAVRKIVIDMVS